MKESISPYPEIDPSTFIHRITFLTPATTVGAAGTQTVYRVGSPPTYAYASINEMNANDAIRAGIDTSQVPTIIIAWWRPSIATAKQHIQAPDGTEYVVKAATKTKGVNVYVIFTCIALAETG